MLIVIHAGGLFSPGSAVLIVARVCLGFSFSRIGTIGSLFGFSQFPLLVWDKVWLPKVGYHLGKGLKKGLLGPFWIPKEGEREPCQISSYW